MKSKFTKNKAIRSDQIEVLYPGVNFLKLQSSTSNLSIELGIWVAENPGPIISQIGVLRGEKGHEVMLNAMVLIKQKVPNIRYLIVGDGPNRQLLEKLVTQLNLLQHVFLLAIWSQLSLF
jgi:glycosyltransferase involved in cell wall biosynthesis